MICESFSSQEPFGKEDSTIAFLAISDLVHAEMDSSRTFSFFEIKMVSQRIGYSTGTRLFPNRCIRYLARMQQLKTRHFLRITHIILISHK